MKEVKSSIVANQARISIDNEMALSSRVNVLLRRNFSSSYVVAAKTAEVTDPIQKLFLDKLVEYKQKSSKLKEGELVDSNPEIEGKRKFGMDNLKRRYGNDDMAQFPKFSFEK